MIKQVDKENLVNRAFDAYYKASLSLSETKVGAAVMADDGQVFTGCNMEHPFCVGVHAEVAALASAVSGGCGCRSIVAVAVASKRERFTPCGACLDWLMHFGGPDCVVLVTNKSGQPGQIAAEFTVGQLAPHYPR